MLEQASVVLFVLNEEENEQNPLFGWFNSEFLCRQEASALYGHKTNIVYESEGYRRNCFLRVKYAVFSTSELKEGVCHYVNEYMKEYSSYQLQPMRQVTNSDSFDDVTQKINRMIINPANPQPSGQTLEPMLPFWYFFEWLAGCPCCSRKITVRKRLRPCHYALTWTELAKFMMTQAGWEPCVRILKNIGSQRLAGVYYFALGVVGIMQNFVAMLTGQRPANSPPPPESQRQQFDENKTTAQDLKKLSQSQGEEEGQGAGPSDPSLLHPFYPSLARTPELNQSFLVRPSGSFIAKDLASKELSSLNKQEEEGFSNLIVHPGFTPLSKFTPAPSQRYIYEALGRLPDAVMLVRRAGTGIREFFCLPNQCDPTGAIAKLRAGAPAPTEREFLEMGVAKEVLRAMRAAEILVKREEVEAQEQFWKGEKVRIRKEMEEQGYSTIPPLHTGRFLDHWREYYRSLFGQWGALKSEEKFSFWNDEPLARFFNFESTQFAEELLAQPLLHSALALSIFIRQGPGFMLHTDTNPPFDVTLDMCLDHANTSPRSVYFAKKERGGAAPSPVVANLEVGHSILFVGSQIYHWGGSLPEDHYHNVVLYTWSYVKD